VWEKRRFGVTSGEDMVGEGPTGINERGP
jgi:hypothetical protein